MGDGVAQSDFRRTFSSVEKLTFWITFISGACWPVCLWWMHRISKEQRAVLQQLQRQGARIESLSQEEHELVKELHPQVGEIKEDIQQMAEAQGKKGG